MKPYLLILISFCFFGFNLMAQELETEMELSYSKSSLDSVILSAILLDEDGEKLSGMDVEFFYSKMDSLISLGQITTNQDGEAIISMSYTPVLFSSTDRRVEFKAEFKGNDEYYETEVSLEIQDAILRMTPEIIDSVSTLSFQLTTWDEEGEEIGVEDGEIYIFVPRLFGLLPTGDAWTDEDGQDAVKFPTDIPGGNLGELMIIAKIEDHESFGNLETSQMTSWGVPPSENEGEVRALWSSKPPLWMIVTFVILMSAVWLHYLYILIKLRQINTDGKNEEKLIL